MVRGFFCFLGFFVLWISKNKKCGGPIFCCQGLEESDRLRHCWWHQKSTRTLVLLLWCVFWLPHLGNKGIGLDKPFQVVGSWLQSPGQYMPALPTLPEQVRKGEGLSLKKIPWRFWLLTIIESCWARGSLRILFHFNFLGFFSQGRRNF